jgi:hypothetical protein
MWAESFSELSAPYCYGVAAPYPINILMIWFVAVDLKRIHEQGRYFSWPRPPCCLRCNNWRIWGHGYVERYFDGFVEALPLKCYRCPDCGCVITLRPDSHFARIHSSKKTVRFHLSHRLKTGRWPPSSLHRSRLRHWLFNLRRRVHAYLTAAWRQGLRAGFEALISKGQTPIARLS